MNGADGHEVVYLPGLMTDNPGLDVEEYRKQLAHLDPVTRRQRRTCSGSAKAPPRWRFASRLRRS